MPAVKDVGEPGAGEPHARFDEAAGGSSASRPSRTEAFWREFLRGLVARGLVGGVQLAISDAHPGLKAALAQVLGAPRQRCTVHFLRDCLGHARRDQHGLLGALIRPIFNADSREQARDRLSEAVAHLDGKLAKVAALLEEAEEDVLAFYAFPQEHWRKLRSTNRSGASSARSGGAPTSSASSPTTPRCCDSQPCSRSRPMTSGSSAGPT
jgi:Transposase, Mutator family